MWRVKEGIRTTARQSCCAADSALVRSEPWQASTMQLVTELTKDWLLQRQLSSRGSQSPKLALARQLFEQAEREGREDVSEGRLCRV